MQVLKTFSGYNSRRYSDPWVGIVDRNTAKINFNIKVGGYTGGYHAGEAGNLYLFDPKEGEVYAYGQKDYRGNKTEMDYVLYENGEFTEIKKTQLIAVLCRNE